MGKNSQKAGGFPHSNIREIRESAYFIGKFGRYTFCTDLKRSLDPKALPEGLLQIVSPFIDVERDARRHTIWLRQE